MFGPTRALAGVNASFSAGQVTAVEGHNGSGKSTLVSLLSLLVRPTRGQLFFGEHEARRRPALRGQVGVLAHAAMLYPDLSGLENLALFARLYRLPDATERVQELAGRFELGRFASRPARTYSRGQLQRVALARAVLHRPKLLLLDEPSTGLDAASTKRLVGVVGEERDRGAIVVLVTHDAELSAALADARVRLRRGRVVDTESQGPDASAHTPRVEAGPDTPS